MQKIIYISLPIDTKGYDPIIQRRISKMYQRLFELYGCKVINPFDLAYELDVCMEFLKDKRVISYQDYLDRCIENVPKATHIFLCNGWSDSKGCIAESEEAVFYGVKVLFESNYNLC